MDTRYMVVCQLSSMRVVQVIENNEKIIRNVPDANREIHVTYDLAWIRDNLLLRGFNVDIINDILEL